MANSLSHATDSRTASSVRESPATLFPDHVVEATDFDMRCEQFLHRWHWRGDRDVVRRELGELIDEAVRNQIP